jgi:hypothetical protein
MQPKVITNRTQYPGMPENLPSISIVIPFESKMNTKKGLNLILLAAANKEEKELMKNYPESQALPLIKKLYSLINNLNCNTHNKSIAIFVSSLTAKVYYYNHSDKKMNNHK